MEKIEIQEIIDLCEEAESDYLKLYRPLLGYEDEVKLNRGIDDSMEGILDEIEAKVGIKFPADLLQLYLIANGGRYFGVNLFHLSNDRNDINGLYYNNTSETLRDRYKIPSNTLIIGETKEDELILIGIDEDGYYAYCTWDKEEKKMNVDFGYILELLVYEIDYNTGAFQVEYNEEEDLDI